MTNLKNISKVIPDFTVQEKNGLYYINKKPLNEEELDHIASECEMFQKTNLYKFWQNFIRTSVIEDIIKKSKNFDDFKDGKAILYSLDKLDNMMSDIIKQQTIIVKNKK